jgi:hypothetical protein
MRWFTVARRFRSRVRRPQSRSSTRFEQVSADTQRYRGVGVPLSPIIISTTTPFSAQHRHATSRLLPEPAPYQAPTTRDHTSRIAQAPTSKIRELPLPHPRPTYPSCRRSWYGITPVC